MISASGLTKSYSGHVLFEDASFLLSPGDRVGLVGRNGTGKSTLFKIILGQESCDDGAVSIPKNYRIGSLEQHIHFTKDTLLEECTQVLTGEEIHDSYKAERILMGLGFTKENFRQSPSSFSGGFQVRINLAKALLTNPSLLLLDEPTNYLDIVSMSWLKQFLRNFEGELILITHDRQFMDDVVTHVMGIHRKKIKMWKGDTANFYAKVMEEEEIYEKTRQNLDSKRKELEAFITRFKAKASKASQARSKAKQLDKLDQLDKLGNEKTLNFQFNYEKCPGKNIVSVKDLAFSYTGKKEDDLFRNLTFHVENNDRIGIIGKNGKGKSTLLNVLAGELEKREGEISKHPSLKIGFFGQTNIQRLSPQNDIVQEIMSSNPLMPMQKVRQICGTLLFERDLALKKIQVLSGGEKARVLLGKILAIPTNLLLLDEPTNHLDMQSIQSLVDEIDDYPGALMVVTHNEMLLHAFAQKLIVFNGGTAELFEGTYQEFLDKRGWASDEEFEDSKSKITSTNEKISYKDLKKQKMELVKERSKVLGPLKKKMEQVESSIVEQENLLKLKEEELLKLYEKSDGKKIGELSAEIHKIKSLISNLFEEFEVVHEQLDKETLRFKDLDD